jgi:hypothetical protein
MTSPFQSASRPPRVATLSLFVAVLGAASACMTVRPQATLRPDGAYDIKCKGRLQACLDEAELVCDHHPYAVLRAFDDHDLKGDATNPTDFRSGEAFVRCSMGRQLTNDDKDLNALPICSAPPPAPVRVCTPGATQACVGRAGCAGGQACQDDGTRFTTCDCGPPPAAAAK